MRIIHDYMLSSSKYQALALLDESSFSDKNSPSWKIFSSVLYDFAKLLAGHCRDMDRAQIRNLVDLAFNQWWDSTPNLARMEASGHTLRFGNANLTSVKTYARSRIRSRLSALIGKPDQIKTLSIL